jgi:hypothetical protein
MKYRLTVWHDEFVHDRPDANGLFTVHSFNSRHIGFTHPDDLSEDLEGWSLSYFEHGLCSWGLTGTMSGMPDFRWDGVARAGFLEVNPEADGDNTSWWSEKTPEERRDMAASFLEEYTEWCNGSIYGYTLETVKGAKCDLGFTHEDVETLNQCGGFIGAKWFRDAVWDELPADATADNTEIVDKAYGMTEYMDFFREPAV